MGSAHTLRGFSLKGLSCRGTHCKMCDFWHLSCSQQHRPKFMFSVLHPTLQGHEENNVLFFLHFPTHPLFPYVPTYLFKLTFFVCGYWISLFWKDGPSPCMVERVGHCVFSNSLESRKKHSPNPLNRDSLHWLQWASDQDLDCHSSLLISLMNEFPHKAGSCDSLNSLCKQI